MMSTLFQSLGGGVKLPPILEEFNSFRRAFSGDAKAEVDRLVKSGQFSQQQINEAQAKANQLMQMMQQYGIDMR